MKCALTRQPFKVTGVERPALSGVFKVVRLRVLWASEGAAFPAEG